MNYAQIRQFDIANGVGVRTTLFVSGCHFHCKGCFNQEYQNFAYGKRFTEQTILELLTYLSNPVISGFSLLGGEPFDQPQNTILEICKRIKKETGKSIWVWSGYKFDDLCDKHFEILQNIDVLVDGQFELGRRDLRLMFRGSSNQRIIDVQKSIENNKVILWER
jgi:anaerobic ribonucleoside-triphosphate reductase activating protein